MKERKESHTFASPMQSNMLLPVLRGDGERFYVQQLSVSFRKCVSYDLIRCSWEMVLKQHDIFRCKFFATDSGKIAVKRTRNLQVSFSHTKLAKIQEFNQLAHSDFEHGFESLDEPLCRFNLVTVGKHRTILLWTSHHALFDGRSRRLLLEEFQALYQQLSQGLKPTLPKSENFIDYLDWFHKKSWTRSKQFWKEQLKGIEEATPLAFGLDSKPRTRTGGIKSSQTISLSETITARLNDWSTKEDISLNILCQGAWSIFLNKTSGNKQVLFAAPRACRNSSTSTMAKTVGLFLNTVPVAIDLSPEKTVRDILRELSSKWFEIRSHEHSPHSIIKAASEVPSKEPLYSSLLGFESYQLKDSFRELGNLSLKAYTDIPFVIQIQNGNRIELSCSYQKSEFSASTIKSVLRTFEYLLTQLIEKTDYPFPEIDLVTKQDHIRIVRAGTGRRPKLLPITVHRLFEENAVRFSKRIAIRCDGFSLNYETLNQRANQMARLFRAEGLRPGSRVGIYMNRGVDLLIAQLAVLKAGSIYVPCDTELPRDRIKWIIENAELSLLVTTSSFSNQSKVAGVHTVYLDKQTYRLNRLSVKNLPDKLDWEAPAYIMYTSGSTGKPKGVQIPHRGIVRLVKKTDYATVDKTICTLQMAPLSFDLSTFVVWGPLLNGGRCIVYPDRIPSFSGIRDLINAEKINTLLLTTSMFNSIIDTAPKVFNRVRQLMVGGEALSPVHMKKAARLYPKARLINVYGPTENTTFSCCYTIPRTQSINDAVPIGTPINNSSAFVLDRHMRLVPPGVPGELYVGGLGVAHGYYKSETLTRERFIKGLSNLDSHEIFYKTGDRCYLRKDGLFEYLDRFDDQVKIRGFRIELGEIQSQLLLIPEVYDGIVLTRKNTRKEIELVAFIVKKKGSVITDTGLIEQLSIKLPDYMVPKQFVFLEKLPLTPNGKVNRSALERTNIVEAPKKHLSKTKLSKTEKALLLVWKTILGHAPKSVYEDFFEAGGHSLSATNFIFKIQKRFSVHLPFSVFQANASVRQLANWIDHVDRDATSDIDNSPLQISTQKPSTKGPLGLKWRTFCIPDIKTPEKVRSLIICRAVYLEGPLRPDLLQKAMEHVVNIHERLRTRGALENGEPVEIIEKKVQVNLPIFDYSAYPEKSASARARMLFEKECVRNLSMKTCPMVVLKLVKVTHEKFLLSMVIQHAVADGHAVEMFYQQTSLCYNELLAQKPLSLKPSKLSYRQFELSLENWLKKGHELRIKKFWSKQLSGLKPIPYPFLKERIPEHVQWNVFDHHILESDWVEKIKSFITENKLTTFIFFTTVIKMMVGRYTNQWDSYATSALNSRSGKEQDEIFGDFSNTIILRNQLDPKRTFIKQALIERNTLFNCIDHRYISVNGLDSPHSDQVEHAFSPYGQLQIIQGPDTGESLNLDGIRSKFLQRKRLSAIARLGFVIRESKDRIQITFTYAPEIFKNNSIDRLKINLQYLIRLVLENPEATLHQFPDLSAPENMTKPVSKSELRNSILKPVED